MKIWRGKHIFLNTKKKENKKHLKIIGKNGNNDISKYLLKNINCNYQTELKRISYKKKFYELGNYNYTLSNNYKLRKILDFDFKFNINEIVKSCIKKKVI